MNSGPRNARNCILESPILKISLVIMLPDPARSSCLRHSTIAPETQTVQIRQLNLWIRYFQMLPKTPYSDNINWEPIIICKRSFKM